MKKNITFLFMVLAAIIFVAVSVIATHVVTLSNEATSTTVKEDVMTTFNITINNTDAGSNANITEVTILLPLNFVFKAGSNATSAIGGASISFTNTSGGNSTTQQTLNWTNRSFLVNNTKIVSFIFNVTAAEPGNYNINVSTRNQSAVISTLISVSINSSLAVVNFTSPSIGAKRSAATVNLSQTFIPANISTTNMSVFGIDTYVIRLYNSTDDLIQNSTGNSSKALSYFANFTSLSDGTYYVNATVNDTNGNSNFTETRAFKLDTTNPTVALTRASTSSDTQLVITVATEANSASASGVQGECQVDRVSGSLTISGQGTSTQTITETSLVCGTSYAYEVTCTDHAGNADSDTQSFSTDDCSSSSSSSGGGGGAASTVSWKNTFTTTTEQVSSGYTKDLGENDRVKVSVNKETHYVGVLDVTSDSAKIQVSSTPQEATLKVGEVKKFDTNADGYYDIQVTLNSVSGTKANLTVVSINEKVPEAAQPETSANDESGVGAVAGEIASSVSSNKLWWIIGVVVVVAIIVGIIISKKKRY